MDILMKLILILSTGVMVVDVVILIVLLFKNRILKKIKEAKSLFILKICCLICPLCMAFYIYADIVYLCRMREADMVISLIMLCGAIMILLYLLIAKNYANNLNMVISDGAGITKNTNLLLTNISHEIRTPMNVIMGQAEVLLRRNLDETTHEQLQNISNAGATLLALVNDILDYSKLESGRLDIVNDEYDIKEYIEDVVDIAGYSLKDSHVDFLTDIDSTIPSKLYGDAVRIKQIIVNLLSNAVKHTTMGVITFRVRWQKKYDDALLEISIEDTGTGIKEEDKKNIFRTYEDKSDISGSTPHSVGLGLAIVKRLVEMMGGSITYSSEYGSGSTFTFTILQKIVNISPIGEYKRTKLLKRKRYSFTAPLAKVLVVDDNMVNLFVTKGLLDDYKLEVTTATSGEDCLKLTNENYYDMIFLDHIMPVMDGVETLRKLRARNDEWAKHIPVIALTANAVVGVEREFLNEGFTDFLPKPVDIDALEEMLMKYLPEEYICRNDNYDNENDRIEERAWYKRFCSILDDIDVREGLTYSKNDYATYLNLLRVVYNDGIGKSAKLRNYADTMNTEAYRIEVHAIKSVTASIGAGKLSFMALEHETAAKNNDIQYICNHIDAFLSEYEQLFSKIDLLLQRESEIVGRGYIVKKSDKSKEDIDGIIYNLIEQLEEYNVDDAEKSISELKKIKLTPTQERVLDDVDDLLHLYKYDEAAQLLGSSFQIKR